MNERKHSSDQYQSVICGVIHIDENETKKRGTTLGLGSGREAEAKYICIKGMKRPPQDNRVAISGQFCVLKWSCHVLHD
jgi:hypothetical protein